MLDRTSDGIPTYWLAVLYYLLLCSLISDHPYCIEIAKTVSDIRQPRKMLNRGQQLCISA